jgi:hypothetical protein
MRVYHKRARFERGKDMNKRFYLSVLIVLVLSAAAGVTVWALSGRNLATAREATARYQRMDLTLADGFTPLFECISDPAAGGMGFHYIQADRFDATLELTEPEALVYAPKANGGQELVAIEYIVPGAAWSASEPPSFLGQTLEYKTTVGPHDVDPYYALHVWVWDQNANGLFADWNPGVTCPASESVDANSPRWVALGAAYGASSAVTPETPASVAAPKSSVGGILEPLVVSRPETYSRDEAYDPAADGHPEMWIAAIPGQSAAVVTSVGVGGIVEPLVASSPASYSGDDLYDPAAGGHPEMWIAAASGKSAAVVTSVDVEGIVEPLVASSPASYSGDDLYDPAADGHPELWVAADSPESAASAGVGGILEPLLASAPASFNGSNFSGPVALGQPEVWIAAASGQSASAVTAGVGGTLGPALAPAPGGFTGVYAFDQVAAKAVASRAPAFSYSGDDAYDPAADGHPELWAATTSTESEAEACRFSDPYAPDGSC